MKMRTVLVGSIVGLLIAGFLVLLRLSLVRVEITDNSDQPSNRKPSKTVSKPKSPVPEDLIEMQREAERNYQKNFEEGDLSIAEKFLEEIGGVIERHVVIKRFINKKSDPLGYAEFELQGISLENFEAELRKEWEPEDFSVRVTKIPSMATLKFGGPTELRHVFKSKDENLKFNLNHGYSRLFFVNPDTGKGVILSEF